MPAHLLFRNSFEAVVKHNISAMQVHADELAHRILLTLTYDAYRHERPCAARLSLTTSYHLSAPHNLPLIALLLTPSHSELQRTIYGQRTTGVARERGAGTDGILGVRANSRYPALSKPNLYGFKKTCRFQQLLMQVRVRRCVV